MTRRSALQRAAHRLRPWGALAVAISACVALPSPAAQALSGSAYNKSACGTVVPGAYVIVTTRLNNDDAGRNNKILPGSYAMVHAFNCKTGQEVKFSGKLKWEITASGWGISGCGASFPRGFTCSFSANARTMKDEWNFSAQYGKDRMIGSSESVYFQEGAGDTTKVCSKVSADGSASQGISATVCVRA